MAGTTRFERIESEETDMTFSPDRVTYSEDLHGGQMWSRVVRRGQVLRIENPQGGATPAGLFYNASQPLERYNMPDTLKAQHIARLTTGYVLYSDMGRILYSVIADSYGWHDTITGHMTAKHSKKRYGKGEYQKLRNDFFRNTRDNFLVELGKHGLGKKDLVPNVNFFTKIAADDDGNLSWQSDSKAGDSIDLRAEMDVLTVLSNTPHPLDPATEYAPKPLRLLVWQADPVAPDDVCRTQRPENERGFTLTESYFK
jgi:urea carboxylase-associated protein 2